MPKSLREHGYSDEAIANLIAAGVIVSNVPAAGMTDSR